MVLEMSENNDRERMDSDDDIEDSYNDSDQI